jgi:hypothetical protein
MSAFSVMLLKHPQCLPAAWSWIHSGYQNMCVLQQKTTTELSYLDLL